MPESLGTRLRQQRERRQVALTTIADETKIKVSLLEALERDDVSHWPAGIFRRAFIRAYAKAIGLDPDVIAREFLELHPDPIEAVTTAPAPTQGAAGDWLSTWPPTRVRYLAGSAIEMLSRFWLRVVRLRRLAIEALAASEILPFARLAAESGRVAEIGAIPSPTHAREAPRLTDQTLGGGPQRTWNPSGFPFLAATAVAVLIFASGVLVGHVVWPGQNLEPHGGVHNSTPASERPASPLPSLPAETVSLAPAARPPGGGLHHDDEPGKLDSPRDTAAPRAGTPESAFRSVTEEASAQGAVDSSLAEPAGTGYAVQITVLLVRSEAEAMARRLRAKGYSAYVATPPANAPSMCRVRVGKFSTRSEAEAVAAKLQREEQFNPWITQDTR